MFCPITKMYKTTNFAHIPIKKMLITCCIFHRLQKGILMSSHLIEHLILSLVHEGTLLHASLHVLEPAGTQRPPSNFKLHQYKTQLDTLLYIQM